MVTSSSKPGAPEIIIVEDLLVEDGNVHSEGISRINVNMLNDANVSAEGIHLIKYRPIHKYQ